MSEPPLRVLVAGAGLGGLSSAGHAASRSHCSVRTDEARAPWCRCLTPAPGPVRRELEELATSVAQSGQDEELVPVGRRRRERLTTNPLVEPIEGEHGLVALADLAATPAIEG